MGQFNPMAPTMPMGSQAPQPGTPAKSPQLFQAPKDAQPRQAARAGRNRYDVSARDEHLELFLQALARRENVRLRFLRVLDLRLSLELKGASFEEVLEAACQDQDLAWRKIRSREYVLGYPEDLEVEFPSAAGDGTAAGGMPVSGTRAGITVVETFRCRHLNAESLAETLSRTFPTLTVFPGPRFKSPSATGQVDGSGGPSLGGSSGSSFFSSSPSSGPGGSSFSGGGSSPMGFGAPGAGGAAVSDPLRRLDVVLVGAPDEVRRAMAFARQLDSGRQQVKINVRLMELNDTNSQDLGIIWSMPGEPGGPPVVNFSELPNPALGNPNDPNSLEANRGLKFGAFAHSLVGANLTAQADKNLSNVKTLANPTLLVLDGERCSILIGDRLLYPRQNGVNSVGNPTFDIAELKVGVYLQMAAQIGQDQNVILSVYPQDSFVSNYVTFNGTSYPEVSTREAQTTVQLHSGETLLIGGLHLDQDSKTSTAIPFLGAIPILGHLFGGHSKSKTTTELVLMIQPEILDALGPQGTSSITPAAGPDPADP
jgi:hypothetical protein